MKISRKEFLQSSVAVAAAALGGAAAAACASSGMGAGHHPRVVSACGARVMPVEGHSHELLVPAADVNAGEESTYETTSAAGHTHTVTLREGDLRDLAAGGQVSLKTSKNAGHRHKVTIACD